MNTSIDDFKLIAAPMAAISHAAFRTLIADFAQPDEYFCEMIHTPSLLSGNHFESFYMLPAPDPNRLVWQLTAPDSESPAAAVPLLIERGGMGIDFNMGCSAPQIVRSGAGIAWMYKEDSELIQLLKNLRRAVDEAEERFQKKLRFSVKLRLGKEANYNFLRSFCTLLVDNGVELITVHPRMQRQSYSRPALYEYAHRLAEDLAIPVYANGDIKDAQSLARYNHAESNLSGAMIGRAVVQKPWIFAELDARRKKPLHIDLFNTALRFIALLKENQPAEFYRTRTARFFSEYCNNFQFAHYVKKGILNVSDIDDIPAVLADYLEENPTDRFLDIA